MYERSARTKSRNPDPLKGEASRTRRPSPCVGPKRILCRPPLRPGLWSFVMLLTCRLPSRRSLCCRALYLLSRKGLVMQRFVLKNFERILVLLLVASMLAINSLIEEKFAFPNFYLPPIHMVRLYRGPSVEFGSRL